MSHVTYFSRYPCTGRDPIRHTHPAPTAQRKGSRVGMAEELITADAMIDKLLNMNNLSTRKHAIFIILLMISLFSCVTKKKNHTTNDCFAMEYVVQPKTNDVLYYCHLEDLDIPDTMVKYIPYSVRQENMISNKIIRSDSTGIIWVELFDRGILQEKFEYLDSVNAIHRVYNVLSEETSKEIVSLGALKSAATRACNCRH